MELSNLRKRRGVSRASITRIESRLSELEGKITMSPGDHTAAQRLLKKLDELDADFKSYHFSIIDLLDTEFLDAEQSTLDEHDDSVRSGYTHTTARKIVR